MSHLQYALLWMSIFSDGKKSYLKEDEGGIFSLLDLFIG
jgi:hypothetical protein